MRRLPRSQEAALRDRTLITLSPKLLEWDFTDRIAFSTVILHELAHAIDRFKNWKKYVSVNPLDQHESLEYEADDFVVALGWKDGLIETLRLTIARYREHGMQAGMADKRLSRLLNAAQHR